MGACIKSAVFRYIFLSSSMTMIACISSIYRWHCLLEFWLRSRLIMAELLVVYTLAVDPLGRIAMHPNNVLCDTV